MGQYAANFEIVSAIGSASPKTDDKNQDRAGLFGAEGGSGVVVCDGVGEYSNSAAVAEQVVSLACDYLSSQRIKSGYRRCAHEVDSELSRDSAGATTMLVISAEQSGFVGYSLAGNGSVIEAEGLALGEGRARLQWTDLVLPHVSYAGGRQALRSYLPSDNGQPLEVSTGSRLITGSSMRLFLACTDGISSDEDRRVGTVPDKSMWKEIPRPLAVVLSAFEERWISLEGVESPECELQAIVESSLQSLSLEGALEDDATIGSVLLRPIRVQPNSLTSRPASIGAGRPTPVAVSVRA